MAVRLGRPRAPASVLARPVDALAGFQVVCAGPHAVYARRGIRRDFQPLLVPHVAWATSCVSPVDRGIAAIATSWPLWVTMSGAPLACCRVRVRAGARRARSAGRACRCAARPASNAPSLPAPPGAVAGVGGTRCSHQHVAGQAQRSGLGLGAGGRGVMGMLRCSASSRKGPTLVTGAYRGDRRPAIGRREGEIGAP